VLPSRRTALARCTVASAMARLVPKLLTSHRRPEFSRANKHLDGFKDLVADVFGGAEGEHLAV